MNIEYFTTKDFTEFNRLKSTNTGDLSDSDKQMLDSVLSKFKTLGERIKDKYSNSFSFSFDNKWLNPVKGGAKVKNYFWYKIFPSAEATNKKLSFSITLENDIVLRIDSVGWNMSGKEREKLLYYREQFPKTERLFTVNEILKYKSFEEFSLAIVNIFTNQFTPLLPGALRLTDVIYDKSQFRSKRYWAGGYHWGKEIQLDRFLKENIWEIGWEKTEEQGKPNYDLLEQIKVGDYFALKSLGGNHTLKIAAIGIVKSTNKASYGFIGIDWQESGVLYHGSAPKGQGAGNWFGTLLEVTREEDIQTFFGSLNNSSIQINLINNSEIGTESPTTRGDQLADIIHENIKAIESTQKGNIFGLFGPWGRGKTYIWELVQQKIKKQTPPLFEVIEFLAWKYQDTPSVWAYLYEVISEAYIGQKWFKAWKNRIFLNYIRSGFQNIPRFIPITILAISIIISVIYGLNKIFEFNTLKNVINYGSIIGGATLIASFSGIIVFLNQYKPQAKRLINKLLKETSFKDVLGLQAEIQNEIKHVINAWSKQSSKNRIVKWALKPPFLGPNQRLLLFIDDIDRCDIQKVIDIIDALRIMLDEKCLYEKIIIVAAIDNRMLEKAIANKIIPSSKTDIAHQIREYIDKIFMSGIKLPIMENDERRNLSEIILKNYLGENNYYNEAETQNNNENPAEKGTGKNTQAETEEESIEEDKIEIIASNYLTFEQQKALEECLNLYSEITPRQMRIIFYRCLMAQNIINKLYPKINSTNQPEPLTLPLLILLRSLPKSKSKIDKEKLDIIDKLNEDETKAYKEVLDLVVAY